MPYPSQGIGVAPHAASHQDGGSDEISVAALSGLLADGQTPLAHTVSKHSDMKFVRKTADDTITSSAVLWDDDELYFAIAANEVWVFEVWLYVYAQTGTPDIKFAITTPAGSSVAYTFVGLKTVGTLAEQSTVTSGAALIADILAAETKLIKFHGLVVNGATAGNVQLQWAQNTSNVAQLTVKANSCIIANKLA